MGYLYNIRPMKYFILALLLVSIVSCKGDAKLMETCLRDVKESMDFGLEGTQKGLTKNWLDMAKNLMEAGAETMQTYEDCKLVMIDDSMEWFNENATKNESECMGSFIQVYFNLMKATDDIKAHKGSAVILEDFATVASALKNSVNRCMPN